MELWKQRKLGFIDKTGEYVIAPELDYLVARDYLFKHNVCYMKDSEGNVGLLSREGTWALPQEYSCIDYVQSADAFILCKDGKKGVVRNGSFEWVYPMEYDIIDWIDAPSGDGYLLYRDFCVCHVSADGTVINPFVISRTKELKYMTKYNSDCSDEYAISDRVVAFVVCNLWGVMDKCTGKVLVPAMYGEVEMVSENIIRCSLDRNGLCESVLYDLKGNKIQQ